MIAGVRQFKLINALGREYDMTRPDALLHAPDGLGWGTERTVNRLGMTYIGINEKEIHQSPSGEMVFRTYEEYGRFLSFCQQGGLVLCYKPLETWYYCECLISIQKSEIQWENNHLICPVQFTLLSYWYEKVVAQTAEPPEPVEPNYSTVTGDPAVFNARYSYPIKDLSVAIQGRQELNGYDKPWVGGAGKNLLPDILNGGAQSIVFNGVITLTVNDGKFVLNGGRPDGGGRNTLKTMTITLPAGTYTLSKTSTNNDAVPILEKREDNSIIVNLTSITSKTFTLAEETNVFVGFNAYPNTYLTDYTVGVQLEKGSTATDWTPYANICPITSFTSVTITQTGSQTNTYTVELTGAGNVYKGTLDATSGELVVDSVVETFDIYENSEIKSTIEYLSTVGVLTNVTRCTFNARGGVDMSIYNRTSSSYDEKICNFVEHSFAYNSDTPHWYRNTPLYVFLPIDWGTDKATISAKLNTMAENGTPLQFVLPLATPLTYQLTPTQMSNLIGQNTIQADAGAVTVTYRTDARTEYKIYPYQYSYKYGDTAQNVFDISCDLPSYFKLTIFGERTNPSWRVVQNGSIVKSGKLNATIGSSQKLVINTDPKNTEIALYTLSNTRINNLYGYSDFATERIFALPQGESQVQVLTEDEQPPKVMIEVLKHV